MLIWSAIVKNESRIINRCIDSLLPYVEGAIVVDTGSTDGTPDLIKQRFADANKPLELHAAEFQNFSQARNEALSAARNSNHPWRHLLLCDADMELVVQSPEAFKGLNGGAYDMRQVAGGNVSYWNRRILSRDCPGEYLCPTHEFLDAPSTGQITNAYFLDHADGANRPDKLARDVLLLSSALATETNPGLRQREEFYLAQSYFDMGAWDKAAAHYLIRASMGGWDEECWNAQYKYAHALGNMGDAAGFVWEMLKAYEMRPQRAEVLHDLAKYFRELGGANFRSLLFSDPGLAAERPDDKLFVSDYTYRTGLKEEFSICAYYDPARRERGATICNELALDRGGTDASRQQARNNLYWFLKPLNAHIPSLWQSRIPFTPPETYAAMNPSIVNFHGAPTILIRTVNYEITAEGRYRSRTGDVSRDGVDIIRTRNFLARLSDSGQVESAAEIGLPSNWPDPQFDLVRGFEDSRLFVWHDQLWTLSTVRELTPEGWCEMVISPLIWDGNNISYGDWQKIIPEGEKRQEKNWTVMTHGPYLDFLYRPGTTISREGKLTSRQAHPKFVLEHLSGGSQGVFLDHGSYLAVMHEAAVIPGKGTRFYSHRFVHMDFDGSVWDVSPPFYFQDRQIEFCAGLAVFGEHLILSYGIRDEEAWTARMRLDDVLRFVRSAP